LVSNYLRQLRLAQQLEEREKEAKKKADEDAKRAREK